MVLCELRQEQAKQIIAVAVKFCQGKDKAGAIGRRLHDPDAVRGDRPLSKSPARAEYSQNAAKHRRCVALATVIQPCTAIHRTSFADREVLPDFGREWQATAPATRIHQIKYRE